ncbi:MAG TPA: cytochrome c peroxidase [Xanthobacteraceae bacterium]|nr:cytochrome c peroxidase [Xanthobacteraceae bacterium]
MTGILRFDRVALAAVALAGMAASAPAQSPSSAELARMKSEYRRPAALPVDNRALAELGRLLFWDPRVSASGKTACAGCHSPDLGWGVLEPRSRNDSGKLTSRKSQPLIGIGHVANGMPFGWHGRNATLEAQAKNSIATGSMSMRDTPTPVAVEVIEQRIRDVPEYAERFKVALPGGAITIDTIAQAIAAYERTMEPGPAAFDRWIEGDESAISDTAKRGFVLFNTKTTCFACHSGWRFTDDKFHDIGVSRGDRGRGAALKDDEAAQFAFKTPTLRSVALRPPYMHDASQATLLDVVKHYEQEPADRPSRSPLFVPVELTEQERGDLVAFMQTLTGSPEGEPAPLLPGTRAAQQ